MENWRNCVKITRARPAPAVPTDMLSLPCFWDAKQHSRQVTSGINCWPQDPLFWSQKRASVWLSHARTHGCPPHCDFTFSQQWSTENRGIRMEFIVHKRANAKVKALTGFKISHHKSTEKQAWSKVKLILNHASIKDAIYPREYIKETSQKSGNRTEWHLLDVAMICPRPRELPWRIATIRDIIPGSDEAVCSKPRAVPVLLKKM